MSPRILDVPSCPHCKTALPKPTPRMCPSCGGSLQKRHLSIGCLTSAPPLIALAIGVGYLWPDRSTTTPLARSEAASKTPARAQPDEPHLDPLRR